MTTLLGAVMVERFARYNQQKGITMNTKKAPAPHHASFEAVSAALSKPEEQITTTVRFEDTETVFFEPTKDGMQVVMKGEALPQFEGNFFSREFLDYMKYHKLSDVAVNCVYDAVYEGLRKGSVLDALLGCMK